VARSHTPHPRPLRLAGPCPRRNPPPPDAAWTRMDCVVVSWLYNTISADLLDAIHDRNGVCSDRLARYCRGQP
jgi:hypothetical protein